MVSARGRRAQHRTNARFKEFGLIQGGRSLAENGILDFIGLAEEIGYYARFVRIGSKTAFTAVYV